MNRNARRLMAKKLTAVDVYRAARTLDATQLRISSTGWRGVLFPKWKHADIVGRWKDGSIREVLRAFTPIPFVEK